MHLCECLCIIPMLSQMCCMFIMYVITAGPAWQSLGIGWHCVWKEGVIPDCVGADKFQKVFFFSASSVGWNETGKPFLVTCFSFFPLLVSMFCLNPPLPYTLASASHVCMISWHTDSSLYSSLYVLALWTYHLPSLCSLTSHSIFFFSKLLSWILSIRDCEREISVVSVCMCVFMCVCLWGWRAGRKDFLGFLSSSKMTTRNTIIV